MFIVSCRAKKAEKTTSKLPNTWETKFCCCSKRYTSSFVTPLNQKRFLERIGKKRVHVISLASKIVHTALNEAVKNGFQAEKINWPCIRGRNES